MQALHRLLAIFLFTGYPFLVKAFDYKISAIPDSLKKNASAVVRMDSITLNIADISGYMYKETKVVSILDASQDIMAFIPIPYYDREVVTNFKAWLYDADGSLVKNSLDKEIMDVSGTPAFIMATSLRYKILNMKKINPPYTIKYTFEKQTNGTFFLPPWFPATSVGVSVQQAVLVVNCGNDIRLNSITLNTNNPLIDNNNFLWEVKDLCAVKKEDYGPGVYKLLPHVTLMLKSFELYDKKGTANSWNDIGIFINSLNDGKDNLKHTSEPELNDIFNSGKNNEGVVRALYKYVQDNFRYVAVALGIGGWQAKDAAFTLKNKYGDCKALAMVMKALLEKADIESYYTLVMAGNEATDVTEDLPNTHFNHVILCVPLPQDTIWLDCTNNVIPFNYLGSFTSNRKALLTFDGGGRLVETPDYDEKCNKSNNKAQIKFDENTTAIHASITREGILQDDLRAALNQKDDKDIEKAIFYSTKLKNTLINSHTTEQISPDKPIVSMSLELSSEGTIRKSEARIFIKSDIFTPVYSLPEKNEKRVQPVKVAVGYTQSDTLIYELPAGYSPENFKPEQTKEYSAKFGNYNCRLQYSAATGELQLLRSFCLKQATYPADDYTALREFLSKSMRECCPELVLKKM